MYIDFISTNHSSVNEKLKKESEFLFCSVANLLNENLLVLKVHCRIS